MIRKEISICNRYNFKNVNEMYDPKMDLWITLNSMPSERSGISATSINNATIYVFGGENMTKTYNNNEK